MPETPDAVTLQIDDSGVETALKRLSASLAEGYADTLNQAAKLVSEGIADNFILRGGGGINEWEPLKARTIEARESKVRRHGITPIAEIDAPLRFTGRLFHAATDTTGNADGSDFLNDGHTVQVGVNTDEITYAERAMGLTEGNTPVRDPITLSPQTESEILQLLEHELAARIAALSNPF